MRVAVYARVSTARQAQAQTIEQQLDRLRAAVTGRGWELDDQHVYRDDGYSGASLAGRGWTGCEIMRHWPILMWSWWPRRTGWPATTCTRCFCSRNLPGMAAGWSSWTGR